MTATLDRDFEVLREGERFTSPGRTVTESDLVSFAALTGDFHPQHVDAAWAADSRFGERIAHGMLVASYALGLVPFDPERVVALRRIADVTFKAPVRIGDTIRVEGQVEGKRELDPGHGLVTTLWRVVTDRGETAARLRVEVLWRRAPGNGNGRRDGHSRDGVVLDAAARAGATAPAAPPDELPGGPFAAFASGVVPL